MSGRVNKASVTVTTRYTLFATTLFSFILSFLFFGKDEKTPDWDKDRNPLEETSRGKTLRRVGGGEKGQSATFAEKPACLAEPLGKGPYYYYPQPMPHHPI